MTKFSTIFACLLLACSYSFCDASFSRSWFSSNDDKSISIPSPAPAPAPDCDSTINDVMRCVSFLYSDNGSKPDKGCCSGFIDAATTNMLCLCAIINGDQLKMQRSKAITILRGCGIKSPLGQCGQSPVSRPAPPKASNGSNTPYPEPEPIKSHAAPSPSVTNTAPAPAPEKSIAAPSAYPISSSLLIAICSIFFVYFF